MKLQDFTGGKNSRLRPQFLQLNEGAEYSNINSRVGSLVPVKSKLATAIEVEQYHTYYEAQQEWVSSTVPTDYLEFQKTLYSADRVGQPQKYDGTNTYNLGIDAPVKLTSFTVDEYPEEPKVVNVDVDDNSSGLPKEDLQYLLVNTDVDKFSKSLQLTVQTNGRVVITADATTLLPSTTAANKSTASNKREVTFEDVKGFTYGSTGVDVYRAYAGTFYKVGNLASDAATLVDNVYDISANTEFDEAKFGKLFGTLQYALTYYNSADGTESALNTPSDELELDNAGSVTVNSIPVSSDPQVDKKRLYRIGGNLSAFTLVTELDNTTASFVDNLSDTEVDGRLATTAGDGSAPTGLAFLSEAYAMLFGAVGTKLVFTPIGEPNNWPALNFLNYEADITGIAPVANGILVFTKFKTHLVTGTGPTSLSTQVLSNDQGCIAFESVVKLSGAAVWASTDGVCLSDGSYPKVISKPKLDKLALTPIDATVYDEVYYLVNEDQSVLAWDFGDNNQFKDFSLGVSTVAVANDKLYGWDQGTLYELFADSDNEEFKYLSPRMIEGRASELKTYKKVYIYSKGDIIIKIIIDDQVVCTTQLTSEGISTIQVPSDKQRGAFVQFDISGTGEVYEVEYEAGRRNNS